MGNGFDLIKSIGSTLKSYIVDPRSKVQIDRNINRIILLFIVVTNKLLNKTGHLMNWLGLFRSCLIVWIKSLYILTQLGMINFKSM